MSVPAASPLHAAFHGSYRQLVQFLTRKTGNPDDARELTQDLWLRLQQPGGEAPRDPQAYLFTMARNLALDHLRHRQVADSHAQAWLALHPDEPAGADASAQLAQRRVLQAVAAALAELPARTREVFIDFRIHGIGHDALAARHGVTRSTIERDVIRAGRAVQAVLERWHASAGGAPAGGRRRQLLGSLLGLAGLAGSGVLGWTWWRAQLQQWRADLASAAGQQAVHPLPDGSRLTLDAASAAAVAYGAARRQVRLLRGAAFFDVAHAPGRPFVVEAGGLRVTVLGTRFAVDLQEGGGGAAGAAVEVAVESGLVRVEPLDGAAWPAVQLQAGQVLRLAGGQPALLPPQPVAPWRSGWLGFREAPLGEVAARLRRYTGTDIRVDPAAAQLPVTAEIRIAQAAAWLRLLPQALPVRVDWPAGQPARVEIALRAG